MYGDGSGLWGRDQYTRRCGWSIVQGIMSSDAESFDITGALLGPLPGFIQDVPAAESFAFLMALKHALPPITFVTDSQFVVDCFDGGPEVSAMGVHKYANIWRAIWVKLEDFGKDYVTVIKVPAHTSKRAVYEGRISARHRLGNAEADTRAKEGAHEHAHDPGLLQRSWTRSCSCRTLLGSSWARRFA